MEFTKSYRLISDGEVLYYNPLEKQTGFTVFDNNQYPLCFETDNKDEMKKYIIQHCSGKTLVLGDKEIIVDFPQDMTLSEFDMYVEEITNA